MYFYFLILLFKHNVLCDQIMDKNEYFDGIKSYGYDKYSICFKKQNDYIVTKILQNSSKILNKINVNFSNVDPNMTQSIKYEYPYALFQVQNELKLFKHNFSIDQYQEYLSYSLDNFSDFQQLGVFDQKILYRNKQNEILQMNLNINQTEFYKNQSEILFKQNNYQLLYEIQNIHFQNPNVKVIQSHTNNNILELTTIKLQEFYILRQIINFIPYCYSNNMQFQKQHKFYMFLCDQKIFIHYLYSGYTYEIKTEQHFDKIEILFTDRLSITYASYNDILISFCKFEFSYFFSFIPRHYHIINVTNEYSNSVIDKVRFNEANYYLDIFLKNSNSNTFFSISLNQCMLTYQDKQCQMCDNCKDKCDEINLGKCTDKMQEIIVIILTVVILSIFIIFLQLCLKMKIIQYLILSISNIFAVFYKSVKMIYQYIQHKCIRIYYITKFQINKIKQKFKQKVYGIIQDEEYCPICLESFLDKPLRKFKVSIFNRFFFAY